eukprot:snap_masked-scaffold_1-processed-gene-15.34-mRNA-1 protein AED:1.00 eAED:1.00 QI:0/0/0/0/1/1/2/0/382
MKQFLRILLTVIPLNFTELNNSAAAGLVACKVEDEVYNFDFFGNKTAISFHLSQSKSLAKDSKFMNGFQGFNILKEINEETKVSIFKQDDITEVRVGKKSNNTDGFENLVGSAVGYCFADFVAQLMEDGHIGKQHPPLLPLMQLGLVLIRSQSDNNRNLFSGDSTWDVTMLKKRIGINVEEVTESPKLRERFLQSCSTTEWYRLGDGKCDQEFNTVECNFDNGDCCSHTCKSYGDVWSNSLSPEDDDIQHPVYSCSINDAVECVPNCQEQNQQWLGDEYCDLSLNNAACGYDLGDCCEDMCVDGVYECGVVGYNCVSNVEGWCKRSYCGNEYFGQCGLDGNCVKSLCGDCYCHYECQEHDEDCSCDGLFTFGCLNVFRDWCD